MPRRVERFANELKNSSDKWITLKTLVRIYSALFIGDISSDDFKILRPEIRRSITRTHLYKEEGEWAAQQGVVEAMEEVNNGG